VDRLEIFSLLPEEESSLRMLEAGPFVDRGTSVLRCHLMSGYPLAVVRYLVSK
jgi:hypothetical protein